MIMNIKTTLTAASVGVLIICAGALAQSQYPSSSPSSTSMQTGPAGNEKQPKAEKLKHWIGSLVDTGCMVKEMSSISASGGAGPSPNLSHWMQAGQQGQRPMGPGQGNPTGPAGQNREINPDLSQGQAAQMARASMIDQAAKRCTPTASTQAFGLALSDGRVVNFDGEGNAKASEALKEVSVQPGKKVKAKVAGTLEGETVKVASVEIKGKRSS